MNRRRDDTGSAIVEFVLLAIVLLVPLVYVVLTAVSVQRAAFGATQAAREAARAYATAGSDAAGERRAAAAAQLAFRDQGVEWTPSGRVVSCGVCAYQAGSSFTVDLHAKVRLPLVPQWLCGSRCVAAITVSAHHRERLDCYSGLGGAAAC
jgi:Flp pilus assembly protein TadG